MDTVKDDYGNGVTLLRLVQEVKKARSAVLTCAGPPPFQGPSWPSPSNSTCRASGMMPARSQIAVRRNAGLAVPLSSNTGQSMLACSWTRPSRSATARKS